MTMLERAAKAVWTAMADASLPYEDVAARAVIRAIREPDERVLEAMAKVLAEERGSGCEWGDGCTAVCMCRETTLAIWQAGIDAAMEERG